MSMLFKRIKDWAVSIASFRTGDVIPVDGPNGTAKMSKDDLLMETAENALAGNLAPAFDPTRDAEHPYLVGEVVIEGGELYECTVEHSGVWNPSHFLKTSSDKLLNRIYASQNELSERIALDESGVGAITDGFIMNQNGVVHDSGDGYKCTDFIRLNDKCEINAVYMRTNTGGGVAPIAFYDSNKAYLGWINVASQGYVTGNSTKVPTSAFPAGAVYFRVTIDQSHLSSFRVVNPTSLQGLSDRVTDNESNISANDLSIADNTKRLALDESGVGAITDGFIMNQNGVVHDSGDGYKCTDFIRLNDKCEINAVYMRTNTGGGVAPIAFYDSNKAYLGWINVASQGYVTGNSTKVPTSAFPAGAVYFRVTIDQSHLSSFRVVNPTSLQGLSDRVTDNESNISANDLSIADNTKRLALDESGVGAITDGFIKNQNGVVYDSGDGYKCTDFIRLNDKCEINAVYMRTNTGGGVAPIAFYDSNKAYLGWINVASQGYVTGNSTKVPTSAFPAGAVYFRVTIDQSHLSSFRVVNPTSLQGLSDRLDSIIQGPSVWMPEKVFALDGTTLQIFKGGIALVKNPDNYELHIVNPSSSHCGYNRDWCYEYDVDDTNSDFVLRFGVTNETMENPVMCSETEIVHVSKKSSPASNKNILCIGDSFTDAGYWVSEFKRLLTGVTTSSLSDSSDSDITADALTNLTFIGTRDTDNTPNEGVSGMDYNFFASSGSGDVTNPFWNPNINDVDFDYYCTQNGFSGIDYAVILLGTNYAHSQASVFKVWDKLLAHNPNIKVLILGRCFGSPYGAGVVGIHKNQEFLSLSNGAQLWNSTLQSYCKRDEYKNNFCFLDYNTQMDIFSNFRFSLLPCNIRNTEVTRRGSTKAYDNVHPWIKAYWQIADVVRAGFHYWCLE